MSRWVLLLPPWLLALVAATWALSIRARLPARLVVQFQPNGEPGLALPRDLALGLMGVFVLSELLVLSWVGRRVARNGRRHRLPILLAGAATVLVLVAGEVGVLVEVLRFNLEGTPLRWGTLLLAAGLGALLPLALAVVAFGPGGAAAAAGAATADWERNVHVEIHRSSFRFWVNLPFAGGLLVGWVAAPHPLWRVLVGLLALVTTWALALIIVGFRYEFSDAGLRVLGLGRLLAVVPRAEVLAWDVRPVRPLHDFGGWGVRGGGSTRAFIWSGRRALRLLTTTGTIWLGHDHPDRLEAHLQRWRSVPRA